MISLESRTASLKYLVATGVAVVFTACSSGVGSKDDPVSVAVGQKQTLDLAGEAFIARFSEREFLVGDNPGGLNPEDSTLQAIDFMRKKGCNITDVKKSSGLNGETTGKFVIVSNPKTCLPELK